jgi:hypothetical protein
VVPVLAPAPVQEEQRVDHLVQQRVLQVAQRAELGRRRREVFRGAEGGDRAGGQAGVKTGAGARGVLAADKVCRRPRCNRGCSCSGASVVLLGLLPSLCTGRDGS